MMVRHSEDGVHLTEDDLSQVLSDWLVNAAKESGCPDQTLLDTLANLIAKLAENNVLTLEDVSEVAPGWLEIEHIDN